MNSPPLDWVYYHALYHQVTHWAGFYATTGLLISILILLSTTRELDRSGSRCCYLATFATVFGSWFFLQRVLLYARIVMRMLPSNYKQELSSEYTGPWLPVGAGIGTLILGITACWLVAKRSSAKSK